MIYNHKCTLCELHKHAKTVCMKGTGGKYAGGFILGGSPGFDEDKAGKPFIGRSGKLLDSILDNVGLPREGWFLSNTLKCNPSYNHKPNITVFRTCADVYLRKELLTYKPDLIVAMGEYAAKVLLQEHHLQIAGMRNRIFYTKGPMPVGIPFIVTYHPAVTFHQPELLQLIVEDFDRAKKILDGTIQTAKKVKSQYMSLSSIYDIVGIKEAKWIDLDLETEGLDPFLPNKKILSIQLSIKEGEGYYFDWSDSICRELKDYLIQFKPKINGHNIKHDLKWLRIHAGIYVL